MSKIFEFVSHASHAGHAAASLPTASWDVVSFLDNAKSYVQVAGGSLLMLMGTAALVWGGVQLARKLMNPQNSRDINWGTIVALFLVGGALAVGGFSLVSNLGSGGQTTINELGGGASILFSIR